MPVVIIPIADIDAICRADGDISLFAECHLFSWRKDYSLNGSIVIAIHQVSRSFIVGRKRDDQFLVRIGLIAEALN